MSKWDEEREWLKATRDVAENSQERATQEYDIVGAQQESLWDSLIEEFRSALTGINTGSESAPLLRFDNLKNVQGFAIIAQRAKNTGTALVTFQLKLNQVTIKFTGREDAPPSLKYTIRANQQNRAEFSQQNTETITTEDIVREALSHLRQHL